MRVHRSPFSSSESSSPKMSSTCSRTTPEQLLRICRNASYSPCRSLMKCSVPLGRLRIACKLMISVNTDCCVGKCSESRRRYLRDWSARAIMALRLLSAGRQTRVFRLPRPTNPPPGASRGQARNCAWTRKSPRDERGLSRVVLMTRRNGIPDARGPERIRSVVHGALEPAFPVQEGPRLTASQPRCSWKGGRRWNRRPRRPGTTSVWKSRSSRMIHRMTQRSRNHRTCPFYAREQPREQMQLQ